MKKPKVHVKKFLDWVELTPYLKEKGIKRDDVVGLVAEHGDFHNGCDVPFEQGEDIYEPPVQKMVDLLFKEFPDAVEDDDTITIHFWW